MSHLIEDVERLRQNCSLIERKENLLSDFNLRLFDRDLLVLRAALVVGLALDVRTLIVCIVDAVAVGVGATLVLLRAWDRRAAVFLVGNAVTVAVATGAALVFLRAGLRWALVFVVREAVEVGVRAPLRFLGACLGRALVDGVGNAIAVGVFRPAACQFDLEGEARDDDLRVVGVDVRLVA